MTLSQRLSDATEGTRGHTPGPWAAEKCIRGGWAIGTETCWVVDSDEFGRYGPIESEQDARLIAAAPELLEALTGLLKAYRIVIDHVADDEFDIAADHPASWASVAERAIAKASNTGVVG